MLLFHSSLSFVRSAFRSIDLNAPLADLDTGGLIRFANSTFLNVRSPDGLLVEGLPDTHSQLALNYGFDTPRPAILQDLQPTTLTGYQAADDDGSVIVGDDAHVIGSFTGGGGASGAATDGPCPGDFEFAVPYAMIYDQVYAYVSFDDGVESGGYGAASIFPFTLFLFAARSISIYMLLCATQDPRT